MSLEDDAAFAADETVRIPRNVMGLLRQSYDTREKVLDWALAFIVAGALAWAFKDEIRSMFLAPNPDPNAGKAPDPQPNVNLGSAFPGAGQSGGRWPALYAYAMPSSRDIRASVGPNGTRPPSNPSNPPVTFGDC